MLDVGELGCGFGHEFDNGLAILSFRISLEKSFSISMHVGVLSLNAFPLPMCGKWLVKRHVFPVFLSAS